MESHYKWEIGDIVNVGYDEFFLCKRSYILYEQIIASRYICVKKPTFESPGMLVKVLGKVPRQSIMIRAGEPFIKDDKEDFFYRKIYYSYKFPTIREVEKVLGLIQNTPMLIDKFKKASMSIDPKSTFWVRETASKFFFMKEPLCYDAYSGNIFTAARNNDTHYRLSIVYYKMSNLKPFHENILRK